MKVFVLSILLAVLAIGSTGCVVVDGPHCRGGDLGRRPPAARPERPHGHDYGPPERHPDSGYERGHRWSSVRVTPSIGRVGQQVCWVHAIDETGHDGPVCISVEDRAYERSLDSFRSWLSHCRNYLRQCVV